MLLSVLFIKADAVDEYHFRVPSTLGHHRLTVTVILLLRTNKTGGNS